MRKSISLLLAFLGLFASLYLLYVYALPSHPIACFGGGGCDAVRASVYAHLWGIPMPALGVAGYLVVALLIIAESLAPAAWTIDIRYALAGTTAFGFLFSLYLEYLQGFVIHHFCTWCVTSGLVMTALCGLSIYNLVRPAPETDAPAHLAQLRIYFVLFVVALLVGIPAFYDLAAHGEVPPPPPPSATDTTAAMLVRPESHVAGNPNAALTVVEFGDFECPVCGSEQPVVHQVLAKYGKQIRFVFRQFPLVHIHPFAMRMAEASECAGEQGKFWQAENEIYNHQTDLTEEALNKEAAAVGLDMDKFKQCMAGGAEAARVKQDHADGVALGVAATPTFFIGREAVPDVPDFDELSRLIDQALMAEGAPVPSASALPTAPEQTPSVPPTETTTAAQPATAAPKLAPAAAPSAPSSFGLLSAPAGGVLSSFQGGGVACSEAEAAKKQPTLINTSQLRELLAGNSKPLFVDVRPAKEFAAGKIPGAINVPIDDMPHRWDTLPKDRVIVFYESGKASGDICASGRAAGRILLEHGYDFSRVKVYQDGLAGWEKSGLGESN